MIGITTVIPVNWDVAIAQRDTGSDRLVVYNHENSEINPKQKSLQETKQNKLIAQFAPPEVAQEAKDVTVIINGQNPGSGVIIAKKENTYFVLTAKHVVATEDEYEIVTNDGQQYILDYRRVKKIPDVDLALVQFTSNQNYSVAKIGDSDAATEGQGIYISGWPHPGQAITDRIFQITTGYISGRAFGVAEEGYDLVYTNITRSGMSGGGVFDAQGRLIGIHGRAEGEAIFNPDTGDTIQVKSGFNLGIPIKFFIEGMPLSELPANSSFAYPMSSWGLDFLRENKIDQASSYFEKALAIAPQSFFALFGMAQTKYQQGQMSEALGLFQSAIELDAEERLIKSQLKWGQEQIDPIVQLTEAVTIYQMGDRDRGLALASSLFANEKYPLDSLLSDWPLEIASNPNPTYNNFEDINDFFIAIIQEYIWSERLLSDAKEMLAYLIPRASHSFAEKVFLEDVFLLSLSSDGQVLATGGHNRPIALWDMASGKKLGTIALDSETINSFVLSADGKTVAIGTHNKIEVWDVSSQRELREITEDFTWVGHLAIGPDSQILAGDRDGEMIQLWEIGSGAEVSRLSGYSENIESISFSPDGKKLVTGHEEGTIELWDLESGQKQMTLRGHSEEVSYFTWSSNREILVSSSRDDTVLVWDLESGQELHSFPGWVGSQIGLSPDDRILAVGNGNAGIQLWNLRTGELIRTLRYDPQLILRDFCFNEDGSQLISIHGHIDNNAADSIKIWQLIVDN